MDDSKPPIFTIGYGNETAEEVFSRLHQHRIKFLIDIRSQPYSKWSPEFTKENLMVLLKREGIRYIFMGDTLGGRPEDPTCYIDGKVAYSTIEQRDWYQIGIARLRIAWQQGQHVALMCSEIDPERCHRSKLIGQTLDREGIPVRHIDRDGILASQRKVIHRLTGGQCALFGEEIFMSNEKYSTK